MLPSAAKDVDPALIHNEEDIISYCLFPEPALEYFRWRDLPVSERPTTPADLEREAIDGADAPTKPAEPLMAPADYAEIQGLLQKVNDLNFQELTIRRHGVDLSLKASGMTVAPSADGTPPTAAGPAPVAAPAAAPSAPAPTGGATINAPLNGTFYRCPGPGKGNFAEEGDSVKKGQPVCIVEAMKLFNEINATANCKVVTFLVKHGDAVKKGQPLVSVDEK